MKKHKIMISFVLCLSMIVGLFLPALTIHSKAGVTHQVLGLEVKVLKGQLIM